MGAGSTRATEQQKKDFKNQGRVRITRCDNHYLYVNRAIGIRYFLNTGRPYRIEMCDECHRDYVREL